MSSYTRQQLEDYIKTLKNIKGNVLDIGGAQQSILKRLNKNELYIKNYKILDLEQPHEQKETVDIMCDLNKLIYNENYINFNEEVKFYKNYFDIAFCIEVSEYWWNPIQALNNINYLMKQNGILYLSIHTFYPIHNPIEQDYLRYTPRGIEKLLKETGFKILEMKPRLFEGYINLRVDGMRPAKEYNKHQWQGAMIKCKKI